MRHLSLCVFAIALLWLFTPARSAHAQTSNLIVNPGFEGSASAGVPTGWDQMWTRNPGSGTMILDSATHHDGQAALKVTHTGDRDWSVEQSALIPVMPGDILRIGAWVKCDDTDSAQIGVVTRQADGTVMDWAAGASETGGTHDWQQSSRILVVPEGCATVQFRFIGDGTAAAWFDDATMTHVGTVRGLQGQGHSVNLQNRILSVTVTPDGLLTVKDKRNGRIWHQKTISSEMVVSDLRRTAPGTAHLSVWDVPDDLTLSATLTLASDAPDVTVTLTGDGRVANLIAFPQPFVSENGTWLVVPMNEGIIYPVDDAGIPPIRLVAYGGHGICMPWYGVTEPNSGTGMMTILRTPDDAQIDILRQIGTGLFVRPLWEASKGHVRYPRTLTYVFFDKGGYVAQAKRYRLYAQHIGLFKTLVQKRLQNPNVDKLIGSVDVWNWDMDKLALCHEMKSLGMDHILWSSGGTPAEVAAINGLGYLTSRYDIYQDVWPSDAPTWLHREGWPEDLVWLPNGDWMKGWADIEKQPNGTQIVYQGGVINSARGLARAKREIPPDLKTTPYECRFIDTTTASPFREDYNPAHPLTRSDDRRNKMALLDFCSGPMHQVVGTETGIDPSVPYVDFYEGMMSLGPYRLPDAGYDMIGYRTPTPDFLKFQVGHFYRVPLWELVYHECVVANWYWGDATNKAPEVWSQRDLYNTLYGTPPLFLFDKTGWDKNKARFIQTYQTVCPVVRRLGYDEMLSHAFLSPDHAVQQTRWRSGTEITVNFGTTDYALPDGRTVKALGSLVSPPSPASTARAQR